MTRRDLTPRLLHELAAIGLFALITAAVVFVPGLIRIAMGD